MFPTASVIGNHLHSSDLLAPILVSHQPPKFDEKQYFPLPCPIGIEEAMDVVSNLSSSGIFSFILYETGAIRDRSASFAFSPDSVMPKAIEVLKKQFPELSIIADLCLCQYTEDSHCGLWSNGHIDNDKTLARLLDLASIYSESGADALMLSGNVDGIVGRLKSRLGEDGYRAVAIYSQTAKFASSLYSAFRRSANNPHVTIDKSAYQVGTANALQALRCLEMEAEAGVDMAFIKPAIFSKDLIYRASQLGSIPIGGFCTSGEHALYFKSGTYSGSELASFVEILSQLKCCGASVFFTYAAGMVAKRLNDYGSIMTPRAATSHSVNSF